MAESFLVQMSSEPDVGARSTAGRRRSRLRLRALSWPKWPNRSLYIFRSNLMRAYRPLAVPWICRLNADCRKAERFVVQTMICVFMTLCVCVCECLCTCMLARVYGRVFRSHNSESVVIWYRNNEERHTYTMSICIHSADLARPSAYERSSPRPSGNEHSSAHRQLLVKTFAWMTASAGSMACVVLSDVTTPLPPVVRQLQRALAETSPTRADGACSIISVWE